MDLVLWKSCSGALHRRKDARERAEMAAKREDRGIGNPTHTAYDIVGATQLEQLSVPFRGPGSSCAMCRLCRRRLRGWDARSHTEFKDMRAVASSTEQVALWSHSRPLVSRYNVSTLIRPSDSFSVGASGTKQSR
jgi:hypothetical protein